MPAQFDPLFNIIRIPISGAFEDQDMLTYIDEGTLAITQTGCMRVLVDTRDAMLSEATSLSRFIAFAQKFDSRYRIAIVYQQLGPRQLCFAERAAKHDARPGVRSLINALLVE